MRKKIIFFTVLIGIIVLLSYLGYNIISKTKEKNAIRTMPTFELLMLNNKSYNNADLKPNLNTVFIYFNSECDFCQHEAQSISNSIDKFKHVQLVFISAEPIENIKVFSEKYNLNNHSNVIFLNDSANNFSNQFNAASIPYILIYDKNKNLIKIHKGQLNAKGILKALNPH